MNADWHGEGRVFAAPEVPALRAGHGFRTRAVERASRLPEAMDPCSAFHSPCPETMTAKALSGEYFYVSIRVYPCPNRRTRILHE